MLTDYRPLTSWPRPPAALPHARLDEPPEGARVTVAGLVLVRQRPGTAKGVICITLEDETGVANVVVWAKVFERFRRAVIAGRLLRVTGRLQARLGSYMWWRRGSRISRPCWTSCCDRDSRRTGSGPGISRKRRVRCRESLTEAVPADVAKHQRAKRGDQERGQKRHVARNQHFRSAHQKPGQDQPDRHHAPGKKPVKAVDAAPE